MARGVLRCRVRPCQSARGSSSFSALCSSASAGRGAARRSSSARPRAARAAAIRRAQLALARVATGPDFDMRRHRAIANALRELAHTWGSRERESRRPAIAHKELVAPEGQSCGSGLQLPELAPLPFFAIMTATMGTAAPATTTRYRPMSVPTACAIAFAIGLLSSFGIPLLKSMIL